MVLGIIGLGSAIAGPTISANKERDAIDRAREANEAALERQDRLVRDIADQQIGNSRDIFNRAGQTARDVSERNSQLNYDILGQNLAINEGTTNAILGQSANIGNAQLDLLNPYREQGLYASSALSSILGLPQMEADLGAPTITAGSVDGVARPEYRPLPAFDPLEASTNSGGGTPATQPAAQPGTTDPRRGQYTRPANGTPGTPGYTSLIPVGGGSYLDDLDRRIMDRETLSRGDSIYRPQAARPATSSALSSLGATQPSTRGLGRDLTLPAASSGQASAASSTRGLGRDLTLPTGAPVNEFDLPPAQEAAQTGGGFAPTAVEPFGAQGATVEQGGRQLSDAMRGYDPERAFNDSPFSRAGDIDFARDSRQLEAEAAFYGDHLSGAHVLARERAREDNFGRALNGYISNLQGIAGQGAAATGQQASILGNVGTVSGNALAGYGNAQTSALAGYGVGENQLGLAYTGALTGGLNAAGSQINSALGRLGQQQSNIIGAQAANVANAAQANAASHAGVYSDYADIFGAGIGLASMFAGNPAGALGGVGGAQLRGDVTNQLANKDYIAAGVW